MKLRPALCLSILVWFLFFGCSIKSSSITVRLGEFNQIEHGPDLRNLRTISQYYLAENLGLPALTDWTPGRFSAGFASSWQLSEDAKTLHLEIRKNLRWSDGTPITAEDILKHFKNISKDGGYHLPSFLKLSNATAKGGALTLVFAEPVHGILDELCRADGILHSGDWAKTSGPYYIAEATPERLLLQLNKHFPAELIGNKKPPATVILTNIPASQIGAHFANGDLDVAMNIHLAALPPHDQWQRSGALPYWGAANVVHFFRIPASMPRPMRIALFHALAEVKAEMQPNPHFSAYSQMIPQGYPSSLSDAELGSLRIPAPSVIDTKAPRVKVIFWDGFEQVPLRNGARISDALKTALKESLPHFDITPANAAVQAAASQSGDHLAVFDGFVGNARTADGSWSYLQNAAPRILSSAKVIKILEEARHNAEKSQQDLGFRKAHLAALEALDVIPVFVSARALFHSQRLDLSLINPLDLRARFWLMQLQ
jgi:hypothetical protein